MNRRLVTPLAVASLFAAVWMAVEVPAAPAAGGGGGRGRGRAPAQDNSNGAINLAIYAKPATSFVSDNESLDAINDGFSPTGQNDHSHGAYGNWPQRAPQCPRGLITVNEGIFAACAAEWPRLLVRRFPAPEFLWRKRAEARQKRPSRPRPRLYCPPTL